MLRINLLPIRKLKKRAKARNQLAGMFFLFLLTLCGLAAAGFLQAKKISQLESDVASLTKVRDSHTPTLKKIEKLKKERDEFDRRTQVIKKLKVDSSLTVRLIDEVANRIDNQRMWLTSLNQQGSKLSLSGIALDNQTVAQFMDMMKASPFVRDVTLTNSSLKKVSGRNLKSFDINCSVAQPEKSTSEPETSK